MHGGILICRIIVICLSSRGMVPTSFQCSPAMVLEQTSAASLHTRRLPRMYSTSGEYSYMALDMLKKDAKRVK